VTIACIPWRESRRRADRDCHTVAASSEAKGPGIESSKTVLVVGDSLQHELVPVGIEDQAVEVRLSGVDAGRQLLIHNHLRGLSFPSAIGNRDDPVLKFGPRGDRVLLGECPGVPAVVGRRVAPCQRATTRPCAPGFRAPRTRLGGRRFAGLEPRTGADFLRQVRSRLEKLSPADFTNRSEVIAAVAVAK
jgi:hypothetical protein